MICWSEVHSFCKCFSPLFCFADFWRYSACPQGLHFQLPFFVFCNPKQNCVNYEKNSTKHNTKQVGPLGLPAKKVGDDIMKNTKEWKVLLSPLLSAIV